MERCDLFIQNICSFPVWNVEGLVFWFQASTN